MRETDKLEFLKGRKEASEASIEYCENKIKFSREELSVINELIAEIEGRQGNDSAAQ